MSTIPIDKEFFDRKRPWSHIKDQVIGSYMSVYLAKVAKRPNRIMLIDAFAGPGIFEEEVGTHRLGSPLIMCDQAERFAKGRYVAIFCNRNRSQHQRLTEELENRGGLVSTGRAMPILGDSRTLLDKVQHLIQNQTVLLYLDPFGLKGCEFETIRPFLERSKAYSTEIIMNISVPIMHRLAAKDIVGAVRTTDQVRSFHRRLSAVLGGNWWQPILWDDAITPTERALRVIRYYTDQLRNYLPYAGYCPVREKEDGGLKYFITFCSRHPVALVKLNDIMCKAYNEYMVRAKWSGTLFEEVVSWKDNRPYHVLDQLVLERIQAFNNRGIRPRREAVWESIITEPDHFMQFTSSEYIGRIRQLYDEKKIDYEDTRRTGRLNDDSLLYLVTK